MKFRFMRHFIWVFTVCKSTRLGVSRIQRVKAMAKTSICIHAVCSVPLFWLSGSIIAQQATLKTINLMYVIKQSDLSNPCFLEEAYQ